MPLRAIIGGETVLAPLLGAEAWDQLKGRVKRDQLDVLLPCCNAPAYLRTSKQGIHHFVHKSHDNCTSKPESWQHLKAKHEIVLACHEAGYEALTEVEGEGWRADVLAIRGTVQIAFEVQWSRQTWEVTQTRQKQYSDAGIRCWLFKTPPSQYRAIREVPLFKLELDASESTVVFNPTSYESWYTGHNQRIPLSDFVKALLGGRIRFCDQVKSKKHQQIRIIFTEIKCWKCHKPYHVYYMDNLVSGCGEEIDCSGSLWEEERPYFMPSILALVNEFIQLPENKHIRMGDIKKRYSKTVSKAYMSFGCPHCDAICGDFFYRQDVLMSAVYDEDHAPAILEREVNLENVKVDEAPHWCFPEEGEFCC